MLVLRTELPRRIKSRAASRDLRRRRMWLRLSRSISLRMLLEPIPGRADDRLGVFVLRFPAEQTPGQRRIGVERDRVARATRTELDRDFLPGHFLNRRDDLLD